MTDYGKLAREIFPADAFNVPNEVYMGRVARALERAALEAKIEVWANLPTIMGRGKQETWRTMINANLASLGARLASLDGGKA